MVNTEQARIAEAGAQMPAEVVVYTLRHALGNEPYVRKKGVDPRNVSGQMLRLRRERARKPREIR